ncbi:MAG: hypothetical protein EOP85_06960 [Verrucomicrobiaceae bacterium]|nr:MAG: hypothetical protein EOP85_06960 [Verrucomicrobiaceae bacterium]
MKPRSEKGDADWITFIFHAIFGSVIGTGIGFLTIFGMEGVWPQGASVAHYVTGTALVAAGLATRAGLSLGPDSDRWSDDDSLHLTSAPPAHNRFSKWLGAGFVLVGAVLVGYSFLSHHFDK